MPDALWIIVATIALLVIWRLLHGGRNEPVDPELVEREIKAVEEILSGHSLDSIKISPTAEPPKLITSSKFGGAPYWPSELAYPLSEDGRPLRLLAQLNCSELPSNGILPESGLIQFFILDDESFGLEYEDKTRSLDDILRTPRKHRVVFHASYDAEPIDVDALYPKPRKSAFPISKPYSLNFEQVSSFPNPCDYRFEGIVANHAKLSDETYDYLIDKYDSGGSKLGGYASFTQDDPRSMKPDEEWLLLFQLDSIDAKGVHIMWGDLGVCNFFIESEKLEQLDFSEVWYNWDCT